MHVAFLTDNLAAVVGFRHHAVFVNHIEHVAHLTALAEGVVTVHTDEFRHFFRPGVANNKHLGKVELFTIDAHDFRLNEADAGKAPAGAGAALVVDGCVLYVDGFRNLIDGFFFFFGFLGDERCARDGKQCYRCKL